MERDSNRILLGMLLNLEIWTFLLLNIICLTCIIKGRLHQSKETNTYLITAFNLGFETFQLVVHASYVGPAILLGDWIFEGQSSPFVTFIAACFLGTWYLSCMFQILMAVNRLAVICFPNRPPLARPKVLLIIFVITVLAIVGIISTSLISPCCRITPDPRYFGYSYLVFENQTENYSMMFLDFPIDVVSTTICTTSYIVLFLYVFRMRKHGGEQRSMKREFRICIQFLIIFLCYNFTWLTFFGFPKIGISIPEAYITTTIVFMANCGANAVIYLTMNKEVRHQFRIIFLQQRRIDTTYQTTNISTANAPTSTNT